MTPGGPTPTGEEEPRDFEQETKFLLNIFENFERNVILEVLKQFTTFEAAYNHLAEFNDINYNSEDEEMEESKGPQAVSA